jgi:F0F1-type ATP synthase membrane subunit c/vacuolar-type H+-ATPase subunit K
MVTCPRCGANIDPSALACPYCNQQTHYGRQHAEQQAAYHYHAAQSDQARLAAERQARQQALTKKAQHAMFWSLAGALTCCFPGAIVGLIMGLNVKGAAKKEGMVAPGTSTVAVVLGCCAIALFCVGVALYINDSHTRDERIAVLKAQVEAARARELIDQPLACGLVELELLEQGFADKSGIMIQGFKCDGKVEQNADRAALYDVHFGTGSSAEDRRVVTACLVRGARWSVKELRADGSCDARVPSAASAASAPSAR